jgi:hypothetical protein
MPKGGWRSTTWTPGWKSGKTTVIRVPEVLAEELLRIAKLLDEGGELPVTGSESELNIHVTGDSIIDEAALKEAVDIFLITIPPRDRRSAKKLLMKFIESIGTS